MALLCPRNKFFKCNNFWCMLIFNDPVNLKLRKRETDENSFEYIANRSSCNFKKFFFKFSFPGKYKS